MFKKIMSIPEIFQQFPAFSLDMIDIFAKAKIILKCTRNKKFN